MWRSRESCEAAVAEQPRRSSKVRVASWNIRYFPDGGPNDAPDADHQTDVDWAACVLASLQAQVVALQELKADRTARAASRRLIRRLNEFTGGDYRLELDGCEPDATYHTGLLYDAARVQAQHVREVSLVKGLETAGAVGSAKECENEWRPLVAAYFKAQGGVDFHFMALHLPSSEEREGMRDAAEAELPRLVSEAQNLVRDDDVIIAGDFNTIADLKLQPYPLLDAESEELAEHVDERRNALRVVSPDQDCTEYLGTAARHLDHILVGKRTKLVAPGAEVEVGGLCKLHACEPLESEPASHRHLSDHCPVTLELLPSDSG